MVRRLNRAKQNVPLGDLGVTVPAMLEEIQQQLGLTAHDPEVTALKQAVNPSELMQQIEKEVDYLEETPAAE